MQGVNHQIAMEVAQLALDFVLDPPLGGDSVVEHASPDQLIDAFASSVGMSFSNEEPAHGGTSVMAAVEQVIRFSVHTSNPRFINQNFAGPDPVAVVGDWLAAALNTTPATFEAAPVFTLMESALLHKLAAVAGYRAPEESGYSTVLPPGLFCPGGSTATLYALQLARHRCRPDVLTAGVGCDRLVLFVSQTGHYSAVKSAALLGLGSNAVIKVDSDAQGAIIPALLDQAIAAATARGEVPFAVIGTAGTTVSSAFDDLNALADICDRRSLWLHVDGCYGGSALFSKSQRRHLSGVERSDSFVWNLHKMMGMTQQCTVLLVEQPDQLTQCFATNADYLFQPDKQHGEFDSGDRTFQCARRVDALKLWLAWKVHGDIGFGERVDHAVAMADHARQSIAASDGAFLSVCGSFTNVVFLWIPEEMRQQSIEELTVDQRQALHELAPMIKARMQAEGTMLIGYQPVDGLNAFRMLFMNPTVKISDVDAMLGNLAHYAEQEWAAIT